MLRASNLPHLLLVACAAPQPHLVDEAEEVLRAQQARPG
jgi:hypothetical protein